MMSAAVWQIFIGLRSREGESDLEGSACKPPGWSLALTCVEKEDEEGLLFLPLQPWLQAGLRWLTVCAGLSWVQVTVLPGPANMI